MGKNDIDRIIFCFKNRFNAALGFLGLLFIREPAIAVGKTKMFIDAVCTADGKRRKAVQVVDRAIDREQNIGKSFLAPDFPAHKWFFMVQFGTVRRSDGFRAQLVISVQAQKSTWNPQPDKIFEMFVSVVVAVVDSGVSKNDNDILFCERMACLFLRLTEVNNSSKSDFVFERTVCVSG